MFMLGSILEQTLIYTPLVVGAYLDIGLMKLPDLSLTSAFTFGAIIGAKMLPFCQSLPQPLACIAVLLCAIAGGMIVGAISSSLTQFARFPHLLSSIITEGLFHGITQMVLGSSNSSISGYHNPLHTSLFHSYPELPVLLLIGITITLALYLLLKTPLGTSFSIYGQNARFFKHHPLSLPYVFMAGVMISNGLAGLAGYCFAQSNGFVDCTMGVGIPLFAITALLLGKVITTQIPLAGALGGLIMYFVLQQLLLKVGFNLNYFTAVQSGILLLVLLTTTQQKNVFNATGV